MREVRQFGSEGGATRFDYDLAACGLQRALDLLGEKWTLLVLREAFYGLRRFDDFARALSCGRGVLSARLKTLVDGGIMESRSYQQPGQRARAEYVLTEKGLDLYPALLAISQWSDRWDPPPEGPAAVVHTRETGRPVLVVMTSTADVESLGRRDVEILPGPSARRRHTSP